MSSTTLLQNEPKTKKGARYLESREPKLIENVKTAMFIKTPSTNQFMSNVLTDFYLLKKPDSIWYRRKEPNNINPFEDTTKLEFYSNRSDASLFMIGSNTKKRPNNLIIGRTYNWQLYDMIEVKVDNYKSISEFNQSDSNVLGSKPMFVIAGEAFQTDNEFKNFANIFVDFFRGEVVENINLKGLDHVIILTAKDNVIHFAHYSVKFKKSGSRVPKVQLVEIGPSMDFTIRRSRLPSESLRKEAHKKPKLENKKKKKNIITTSLKETRGKLHIPEQNIDKLITKRPKALKRKMSMSDSMLPEKKKSKL